ncbi:hypothetical protein OH77DRAFT_1472574 [Trametes cingulata]|nr:hypothetical protein OH77DRAFT_1472574 [Trametes cingulata]
MTEEERAAFKEKVRPVQMVLTKLRMFASKVVHSSTILLPAYKAEVARLKMPEKLIPRDVSTRWNSTFDMLKVGIEYRRVVDTMCADRELGLRKYELSSREWTIATQLADVLKLTDASEAYRIAMILHPSYKKAYFKKAGWLPEWIEVADDLVRTQFDTKYADLEDAQPQLGIGDDLDIYVPWHGAMEMGRWLEGRDYFYQAAAGKHPLFEAAVLMHMAHISSVCTTPGGDFRLQHAPCFITFNFVRPYTGQGMSGRHAHVQLIVVRGDPSDFIVNNFHSTGVMNYLTAHCAVSLFPRTTFVDRTMLVAQDTTRNRDTHDRWMKKYHERGFDIITAYDAQPHTPEVLTRLREVGDRRTWLLPYSRFTNISKRRERVDVPKVLFEVLPLWYRVAPAGAAIRVGPRFRYSALALIINPRANIKLYDRATAHPTYHWELIGDEGNWDGLWQISDDEDNELDGDEDVLEDDVADENEMEVTDEE